MPRYGQPYWADATSAARRKAHPSIRGAHTADVVVIGGGLTGCAAAYALSSAGFDVVMVEAERLAGGATARGFGAILPVPDASIVAVEAAAGRRVARAAWTEGRRSALEFGSMLKRLGIRCDLASSSMVINAPFTADAAALKREQAARKAAGVNAAWLTPLAARAALATETQGALRLRDASLFDPVRAALGLATAALKKGARVFEGSRVKRTTFTRKDVTVVLASATIRTRGVVVATGEPGPVFSQLKRHVRYASGYAVVTEPLTPAMRREVGDRDAVYTEGTESPRWLRWLAGDRALFAGLTKPPVPERLRGKAIVQRSNQLMYELSVRYPVISGLPPAYGWDLPIVTTVDGLPWIGPHRNYPFHFFALAYGWHGDGLAWLAARAAARHFQGKDRKDDEAFGFVRHL